MKIVSIEDRCFMECLTIGPQQFFFWLLVFLESQFHSIYSKSLNKNIGIGNSLPSSVQLNIKGHRFENQ